MYKSVNTGSLKRIKLENVLDKIALEFEITDNRPPVQISFFEPMMHHLLKLAELEKEASDFGNLMKTFSLNLTTDLLNK